MVATLASELAVEAEVEDRVFPTNPLKLGALSMCACAVVLLSLIQAPGARAQESLLDQVEQLADRGETPAARDILGRWEREYLPQASRDDQARAWFLKARLEEDASQAELLYLRVVVEGSSSRYADDALLRLGQYKYTASEPSKAIDYLARLRRDYPTSEHGPTALLWIARASHALGNSKTSCSAAAQGLKEAAPADTLLVQALDEAQAGCTEAIGTYSVQVAALQDSQAASSLASSLMENGYDAWILNASPQDPLYRVRIGRGLGEGEAQALLRLLEADGFSPFLVSQSAGPKGGN